MAKNQQPGERDTLVKGKSPRNAILAVGAVAAVVIAGIGFYYQVKQSNQAAEEAKLQRKERESAAVQKEVPANDDVDKIMADQVAAAKREEAAARAASSVAAAAAAGNANDPGATGTAGYAGAAGRPSLTAQGFMNDSMAGGDLAQKAAHDNIYDSPIFRPGVKVQDPATLQQPRSPYGASPAEVAQEQAAAQTAALKAAAAQQGQAGIRVIARAASCKD